MKHVIFDVSTDCMYIGLVVEHNLVDHVLRVSKNDHAKYLIDRLDHLLVRNHLSIDDIDQLIVGVGPGSYTGIRIGVMVAKMFGFTKKIPVKIISSLLFMTSGYEGLIAPMIDARRAQVFSAIYENGVQVLHESLRLLSDFEQEPLYAKAQKILIDEHTFKIDAKVIINQSKIVADIHRLEPNYLRKTEAEINHDQKSNR